MGQCGHPLGSGRRCSRSVATAGRCWQHSSPAQLRRDLHRATGADKLTILVEAIDANHGPGGLDLSGHDFDELDLSERGLRPVIAVRQPPQVWLTSRLGHNGINLIGVRLGGAFLPRTNLSYARMQLSDLSGADLYGADLTGTDLYRANLANTSMYKARLTSAKLERADLSGANLQIADLHEANLLRARLDGAQLSREAIGPRCYVNSVTRRRTTRGSFRAG
jgi:uncharacterized protein YjbI with pentapeptide repeats